VYASLSTASVSGSGSDRAFAIIASVEDVRSMSIWRQGDGNLGAEGARLLWRVRRGLWDVRMARARSERSSIALRIRSDWLSQTSRGACSGAGRLEQASSWEASRKSMLYALGVGIEREHRERTNKSRREVKESARLLPS